MVHDRLELGRSKEQIDDAVKDKGHRTFRKDFFVRMHFEDITEPATPESKGNESTAEESEEPRRGCVTARQPRPTESHLCARHQNQRHLKVEGQASEIGYRDMLIMCFQNLQSLA